MGGTTNQTNTYSYSTVYTKLSDDSATTLDAVAVSNLPVGSAVDMLINRTANSPHGPGSATPYLDNDDDANNTTIRLPRANAKALGLISGSDSGTDASIVFSSNISWDFNRANGISGSSFDFVGVAAHEIGHVLGFVSGVDYLDANPNANDNTYTQVTALDLFRFSSDSFAQGSGVIDFTADNRDKYFSIIGGAFASSLFAEGIAFGDGQQASHWKDGLGLGIMDPTLATGELGVISQRDKLAIDVIGWDVFGEDYTIRVNPSDNTQGQLLLYSQFIIDDWTIGNGITLNLSSGSGADTLTMDYSNGNALPNGFVRFHGDAESDTVTFLGTSGADDFLMDKTARNFSMEVNDDEPTEFLLLGVQSVVIDAAGGTDELIVDQTNGSPIPSVGLSFPNDTPPESFVGRHRTFTYPAFMVNRTADLVDDVSDGVLDVDTGTVGQQISLRAAIRHVNAAYINGAMIFLPGGSFVLTRTGTDDASYTGDLDTARFMTIVGIGAGATVVHAGGSTGIGERVFDVRDGLLVLQGLTVTGGYFTGASANGGGIRVGDEGAVELNHTAVVGNTAGGVGGGIYSSRDILNSVNVKNSVIARNHLLNASAVDKSGGAGIYAAVGQVRLTNTIVANNTAQTLATGGAYDLWGVVVGGFPTITSFDGNNLVESINSNIVPYFDVGNDFIGSVDYVVTSVVDSNSGTNANFWSLREAFIVADDDVDATIWVPAWHHQLTLSGGDDNNTAGDLDVSGDLDVRGIGAGLTIIDAGGTWGIGDRVLHVLSGGALKLNWATLTGGDSAVSGGGIRVAGVLELYEAAVTFNDSQSVGGGIYNDGSSADTTILESVVAYNHLTNINASNQTGGAGVYATAGTMTIDRSIVGNNIADVLASDGAHDVYGGIFVIQSGGYNLLENVRSALVSIFTQPGDSIGSVAYIVTSMWDSYNHDDNVLAFSLREAVDVANNVAGAEVLWIPGWTIRLGLDLLGSDSGSPGDISKGDIDILEDIYIRGINSSQTLLDSGFMANFFEEIGSANLDLARATIL